MKLRKTLKMLVPILALVMLFGACNKAEAKEVKETKETTTETTTEATEKEDKEEKDVDDDDSAFVDDDYSFDFSDMIPDQNIDIDENYLKFVDYETFFSTDFPDTKNLESVDEIENEIIKEEAQKLLDQGYSVMTADEGSKILDCVGITDEDGWVIAYLYNGVQAWKETDTTYDSIACYIASQDIVDQMDYVLKSDDNGILTYEDDPNALCPSDAIITYDVEKELLTITNHYEWDMNAAPVG